MLGTGDRRQGQSECIVLSWMSGEAYLRKYMRTEMLLMCQYPDNMNLILIFVDSSMSYNYLSLK